MPDFCKGTFSSLVFLSIFVSQASLAQSRVVSPITHPEKGTIWEVGSRHYIAVDAYCTVKLMLTFWPYPHCGGAAMLIRMPVTSYDELQRFDALNTPDNRLQSFRALNASRFMQVGQTKVEDELEDASVQALSVASAVEHNGPNAFAFNEFSKSTTPTIQFEDTEILLANLGQYSNQILRNSKETVAQEVLIQRIAIVLSTLAIIALACIALFILKKVAEKAKQSAQIAISQNIPQVVKNLAGRRERELVKKIALEESTRILVRQSLTESESDDEKVIKRKISEALEKGDIEAAQALIKNLVNK